jgi:hypothetical protein
MSLFMTRDRPVVCTTPKCLRERRWKSCWRRGESISSSSRPSTALATSKCFKSACYFRWSARRSRRKLCVISFPLPLSKKKKIKTTTFHVRLVMGLFFRSSAVETYQRRAKKALDKHPALRIWFIYELANKPFRLCDEAAFWANEWTLPSSVLPDNVRYALGRPRLPPVGSTWVNFFNFFFSQPFFLSSYVTTLV